MKCNIKIGKIILIIWNYRVKIKYFHLQVIQIVNHMNDDRLIASENSQIFNRYDWQANPKLLFSHENLFEIE